jgi:Secretion system C-terminal sorting domain
MTHSNTKSAPLPKQIRTQFATYRNAIARVVFLTSFLTISLLSILPEVSRAQCPDETGPYPSPDVAPWYSGTMYLPIAGTECYLTVTYCWRVLGVYNDTIQVWLSSVTPDTNTQCDSITPQQMISAADSMVWQYVIEPHDFLDPIGWCADGAIGVVVDIYSSECWELQQSSGSTLIKQQKRGILGVTSGGSGTYSGCDYAYWCESGCTVCYDEDDNPVYSNPFTTTSGVEPGCAPPPAPGAEYEPWVCYQIGCAYSLPPAIEHGLKGENSPKIDTSLRMFPNPSSKRVVVTSSEAGEAVQVLDVFGREVLRSVMPSSGLLPMDVSTLPAGTYYISAGHKEVEFIKN